MTVKAKAPGETQANHVTLTEGTSEVRNDLFCVMETILSEIRNSLKGTWGFAHTAAQLDYFPTNNLISRTDTHPHAMHRSLLTFSKPTELKSS